MQCEAHLQITLDCPANLKADVVERLIELEVKKHTFVIENRLRSIHYTRPSANSSS